MCCGICIADDPYRLARQVEKFEWLENVVPLFELTPASLSGR